MGSETLDSILFEEVQDGILMAGIGKEGKPYLQWRPKESEDIYERIELDDNSRTVTVYVQDGTPTSQSKTPERLLNYRNKFVGKHPKMIMMLLMYYFGRVSFPQKENSQP